MSNPARVQALKNALLVVLVFIAATIFLELLSAVVIAVLLYFVLRYRSKVKQLEGPRP